MRTALWILLSGLLCTLSYRTGYHDHAADMDGITCQFLSMSGDDVDGESAGPDKDEESQIAAWPEEMGD